ncbi:N-acetyltransferase [Prolixibacteraceae bacterium]|nr:N-acetyltransferase [Prolixibacteraceae bacterium]
MSKMEIQIRETNSSDLNHISHILYRAFEQTGESNLTKELLKDPTAKPYVSLIAFDKEVPVGFILLTRAYINEMSVDQHLMHILAPLAVIPEYQSKGVGAKLMHRGIELVREMGSELIILLGHVEYYKKFDFIPNAIKVGYSSPYPIPTEHQDAWMVKSLNPLGYVIPKGKVVCCEELNKPKYWIE